jgi:DinB superfamily
MSSVPEFTARLRAAAERIRADVPSFPPDQLTAPDEPSGERWDLGQVLAHTAEILPYWLAQVELVLAAGGNGAPFGRVKSDPGRIAAIEEDRLLDPEELLDRMDEGVEEVILAMRRLTPADLACTGRHSTKGLMNVSEILEEFVVGHLEEHADQLRESTAGELDADELDTDDVDGDEGSDSDGDAHEEVARDEPEDGTTGEGGARDSGDHTGVSGGEDSTAPRASATAASDDEAGDPASRPAS